MKKAAPRKKPESIIPQAKLLRLFQIIAVLKSGHWTIKQMSDRFDTSERTIYRYLKLLEEVDFLIEKDFENRYFIITSEDDPSQSQFSVEETRLIKKLILAGANDNPLKNILLINRLNGIILIGFGIALLWGLLFYGDKLTQ